MGNEKHLPEYQKLRKVGGWVYRSATFCGMAAILSILVLLCLPDSAYSWFAMTWSVTSDSPPKADAIIILGGGDQYRPKAAAELWRRGNAPVIIVFAPEESAVEIGDNLTAKLLVGDFRIPEDVIEIIPRRVSSTYDEAVATAELVSERNFGSVTIPTDIFHSRRVQWIFQKKLDGICDLNITEAPFKFFRPTNWWMATYGRSHAIREIIKNFYYRVRYLI